MSSLFTRYKVASKEEHDTTNAEIVEDPLETTDAEPVVETTPELEVELIPTDETDAPLATEAGVLENDIVESQNDDIMGEVVDSEEVVDQLDTLEEKVLEDESVASVEHYAWVLNSLYRNAKLPMPNRASLEDFSNDGKSKTALLNTIRTGRRRLQMSIAFALEEFNSKYSKTFSVKLEEFKSLNSALAIKSTGVKNNDEPTKINLASVWRLFHVDGKVIKKPGVIKEEYSRIKSLVDLLGNTSDSLITALKVKGVNGEVPEIKNYDGLPSKTENLMNNNTLSIDNNGAKLTGSKVDIPKDYYKGSDYLWFLGWGLLFINPLTAFPAILTAILRDAPLVKKDGKPTVSKESKTEMLGFLQTVVDLKKLAVEVESIVKELLKVGGDSGVDKKEVDRAITPLLSLANVLLEHMTELTNASDKLFGKIRDMK